MKTSFSIRLAEVGDSADISALLKKSYENSFQKNYSKTLLNQILPLVTKANQNLLRSKHYYVAQTQDGQLIGCGGWSFLNPETRRSDPQLIHLRHFATDENYAGLGVGRGILERCLIAARGESALRAECFSSLNAIGFYEKCGFRALRKIDVHITDIISFPTMLMGRDLL